MRHLALPILVALLATACVTGQAPSGEDRPLEFECADSVVIGTVVNGAYQPVVDESDLLGRGWVTASLHVREVVRGASLPSILPVRYFAHAYMREDREFMFVLQRRDAGYQIATGRLMSSRPRLSDRCR